MTACAIGLLDEQVLFRSALAHALAAGDEYAVTVEAADAPSGVALWREHQPGLLVVSSSLPGGGPAAVCNAVAGKASVLVVSQSREHALLVAALEAGAQGYLSKDSDLPELLAALAGLREGHASVPPTMLGGLLHDLVVRRREVCAPVPQDTFRLSRREREVLGLLAEGLGQDGIAKRLVISPQTARTHIQNVLGKMGVHSRVEAVALAREHGLVETS